VRLLLASISAFVQVNEFTGREMEVDVHDLEPLNRCRLQQGNRSSRFSTPARRKPLQHWRVAFHDAGQCAAMEVVNS
jgi:hypothetical protein